MNKKICRKISILLAFGLCVCAGCSAGQERKYTAEELDNLAEIKIYAAGTDELIKTITDEDQLYQYTQCSLWNDLDVEEERQTELEKDLAGKKEQYDLVSYQYPAARFGEKEPEENTTITLYEDTNIIKLTVADESIKSFSLPEGFLTFYCELSEEEMNFYRFLAE